MSLYQVSKATTVVSFSQNQKAPNKVAAELTQKMCELVKDGICFDEALSVLIKAYNEYKEKNVRGIDSVNLSSHSDEDSDGEQTHQLIYLSYKLNGTFATYTEYSQLKKSQRI